jgi:hypothetical protein
VGLAHEVVADHADAEDFFGRHREVCLGAELHGAPGRVNPKGLRGATVSL